MNITDEDFKILIEEIDNILKNHGKQPPQSEPKDQYIPIHKLVIKEQVDVQSRLEKILGPDAEKIYMAALERDRKLTEELNRLNAELHEKNKIEPKPPPEPTQGWHLVLYDNGEPVQLVKIDTTTPPKLSRWQRFKAFVRLMFVSRW